MDADPAAVDESLGRLPVAMSIRIRGLIVVVDRAIAEIKKRYG